MSGYIRGPISYIMLLKKLDKLKSNLFFSFYQISARNKQAKQPKKKFRMGKFVAIAESLLFNAITLNVVNEGYFALFI